MEQVAFPSGDTGVMPSSPLEMESLGTLVTTPAPLIGHDTRDILQELDYTQAEINDLYAAGAVHTQG